LCSEGVHVTGTRSVKINVNQILLFVIYTIE